MQYCVYLELTQRIGISFTADSDQDAEERAKEFCQKTPVEEFVDGDTERDYALCETDSGRLIIDWD